MRLICRKTKQIKKKNKQTDLVYYEALVGILVFALSFYMLPYLLCRSMNFIAFAVSLEIIFLYSSKRYHICCVTIYSVTTSVNKTFNTFV